VLQMFFKFVIGSVFVFFISSCSFNTKEKPIIDKVAQCTVPFSDTSKKGEAEIVDVNLEIQLGFKSADQKREWGEQNGYPFAQIVYGGVKTAVPIEGLSRGRINPIETKLFGSVCEGSIGVMDSLSRLWLAFAQDTQTKVVFVAYDLQKKKIVSGHAPPKEVFGLKYEVGQIFYMTAENPDKATNVFFVKEGKKIPLKEMTLPLWVRIDLSGQQRAAIDHPRTFSASLFKSLFKNSTQFHNFFGWNSEGYYKKQWAYLANWKQDTCIIALEGRGSGEIDSSGMVCKSTAKSPASVQ